MLRLCFITAVLYQFATLVVCFYDSHVLRSSFHNRKSNQQNLKSHQRHRYLRMDDETSRPGIKDDLTTRDEYLATRFLRLSSSGYDLTPLTSEEVANWDTDKHEECSKRLATTTTTIEFFLGHSQKGMYVASIGGLPLFTSGNRLNEFCNKETLFFTEPCDPEHIQLIEWDGTFSHISNRIKELFPYFIQIMTIQCVRSGIAVGLHVTLGENIAKGQSVSSVYAVSTSTVSFLPLDQAWPVESQPENIWGTEGQYLAYKQREHQP